MAAKGTVTIYYRTTEHHRQPVEGIQGFWHASYAVLDGESVTVRLQPSGGYHASEAQLKYHADRALTEQCREHGETYTPIRYQIERS
jgi:hypothetical protein